MNDLPGGAEQIYKMIAKQFALRGDAVKIIFFKSGNSLYWNDLLSEKCELVYCNGSILKLVKFLNKFCKRNTDIFTTHIYLTGFVGILLKMNFISCNLFIGRESTSPFKRFTGIKLFSYRLMYYFGYSKLNLLICQTEWMKDEFRANLPWLSKKINIVDIGNPFNAESLYVSKDVADLGETACYSNYIVSAGRLIKEKGFDILIQSFSELKLRSMNLVILGEGPERDNLEQLVARLDLVNEVYLVGFVDNVYEYFKYAELCVVSSRIEGFPNVLMQMMSQNQKVVSTKCAGGIENIPGIFLSEVDSVPDLSRSMKACLAASSTKNREKFDVYLRKRTINSFLEAVYSNTYNYEKIS
ncbi:MAG TPA: glycosyltransferase [Pedobacter sp.]|nr:glycosyltransferase [Pedobacter sp.]